MKYIYVRELATNKPIHHIDVTEKSERTIERIVNGMMINLNYEKYFIDDTCIDEDKPQN